MSINEVERAITIAAAVFAEMEKRSAVSLAGLAQAQRGIARIRSHDDGRPDDDPKGPEVLPLPDDPAKSLHRIEHYARQLVSASQALYDELGQWHRLGLPRDHPERRPSKDEQAMAEGESLDDDEICQSCARIGVETLRWARTKMCQWCYSVVNDNRPRWPHIQMPPVEMVRHHHEANDMGRRRRISAEEAERYLTIAFGTPRKLTEEAS